MPSHLASQIPPPSNWQDFETLCCDFFSRIWKDPSTQQNGREGQPQYPQALLLRCRRRQEPPESAGHSPPASGARSSLCLAGIVSGPSVVEGQPVEPLESIGIDLVIARRLREDCGLEPPPSGAPKCSLDPQAKTPMHLARVRLVHQPSPFLKEIRRISSPSNHDTSVVASEISVSASISTQRPRAHQRLGLEIPPFTTIFRSPSLPDSSAADGRYGANPKRYRRIGPHDVKREDGWRRRSSSATPRRQPFALALINHLRPLEFVGEIVLRHESHRQDHTVPPLPAIGTLQAKCYDQSRQSRRQVRFDSSKASGASLRSLPHSDPPPLAPRQGSQRIPHSESASEEK